jgi:ribosomal protein S27AE
MLSGRLFCVLFKFLARTLFNSDQTTLPGSVITTCTMGKRECLECGGELAMAFRPTHQSTPGAGNLVTTAKWRCSTCGQSFTAEKLRDSKRAAVKALEQA